MGQVLTNLIHPIWISSVLVIAIIILIVYYKNNTGSYRYHIRGSISNLLIGFKQSLKMFFMYFGWFYLLLIMILIIAIEISKDLFPYILIGIIVLFFLFKPLKLVYMLIGAKSSLSAFLMLFIITQLLFAWALNQYLPVHYTNSEIIFNTFCTSLTQQPSTLFDSFLTQNNEWKNYGHVFIILNTQIFISWIYLGVLIAGLYQKLRNE